MVQASRWLGAWAYWVVVVEVRILDLFCGPGGASEGYARAGFEVVGVDHKSQRNPYMRFQADALEFLAQHLALARQGVELPFDAIHASPPCQAFTAYKRRPGHVRKAPNLIPETRSALRATGLPYVIENIPGSPLINPVQLCGTGFGLDIQRHRLFESNVPLMGMSCAHGRNAARFPQATNRGNKRRTVEIGVWRIPVERQREAMGIDWMMVPELSQAIPPAYTEFIGGQLARVLEMQKVA